MNTSMWRQIKDKAFTCDLCLGHTQEGGVEVENQLPDLSPQSVKICRPCINMLVEMVPK